jgi:imidazolonepropionase-like amidohydrolase
MNGVNCTLLCLLSLHLGSNVCWSQSSNGGSSPSVAIRAARLIDVNKGEVITDAVVLIDGEKIKAFGAKLSIPPGTRIMDLGNVTLLPGLIDCHTHLLQSYWNEIGDDPNITLTTAMGTPTRVLLGAKNASDMLDAGFTTVRDVGNSGHGGDVALRNAIEQGWVAGPRMRVSTRALAPIGGQWATVSPETQKALIDEEYAIVTGTDEAVRAVRQAAYDGADLIKVIVGVGGDSDSPEGNRRVFSLPEMKAIVEEAHREGMKVAAHATDELSAKVAVDARVDSIEHGYSISDATLKDMAANHIFLVPTDGIVDSYIHRTDLRPADRDQDVDIIKRYPITNNTKRLQRAMSFSVPIAAGSDYYYIGPGNGRGQTAKWVLLAYANEGMKPMEVLRAATVNAAQLLGWQDRVGSIQPGFYADIIAVDGDPSKNISSLEHIEFVMKGGQVVIESSLTASK